MLSGQDPVCVKSVMSGSAADKAGLGPGDAIVQVNGIDVRSVVTLALSRFFGGLCLVGSGPVWSVSV